ncbi:hypothetical protein MKZ38_004946 [Zalerion maritima]|uniref:Ecp2 effector protein-like domain-containing protein n=1 Tax=Zalerion maritima TaxID=339359 RepID=A0AAD5WP95_9PEZI|nr:hypothetical protein MKZ38_004946 [Zalerion maritima]
MNLSTLLAAMLSGAALATPHALRAADAEMHPHNFHLKDGTPLEIMMAGTFRPSQPQSRAAADINNPGMEWHHTDRDSRDECRDHSFMSFTDTHHTPAPRSMCEGLRHLWRDCVDCKGYWDINGAKAMPESGLYYKLFRLGDCTLGIRSDKARSEEWKIGDQDLVEAMDNALDKVDPAGGGGGVLATGTWYCHTERSGTPLPARKEKEVASSFHGSMMEKEY